MGDAVSNTVEAAYDFVLADLGRQRAKLDEAIGILETLEPAWCRAAWIRFGIDKAVAKKLSEALP